jgi:hypothetical protein
MGLPTKEICYHKFFILQQIKIMDSVENYINNTIPDGPYKKTCTSPSLSGNTLIANCKGKKTFINTSLCKPGTIKTMDQTLICTPNVTLSNCTNARIAGNTLIATCYSGKKSKISSIEAHKCVRGSIKNKNGTLVCTRLLATPIPITHSLSSKNTSSRPVSISSQPKTQPSGMNTFSQQP